MKQMLRKKRLFRHCRIVCLLILGLLCIVSNAPAQSASATLSGTVEDPQGALVPGVTVAILNLDTSLQRQTVTNESGSYTFLLLPPGRYTLTAEGKGFAKLQVPDLVLNVGDQKALNIQLKAGDVNATVIVDSTAETVRTDGSVGTVVNRQFVANMPLNGRSLQPLLQMVPGVVLTGNVGLGGATGSAQFSVNGQRPTANSFLVDGLSANTGIAPNAAYPGPSASGQSPGTNVVGSTASLVSLDAMQEFRIETSSYGAEFGRTPGGQVLLITRSGTNTFHGSASYYFRHDAMDANDWFANSRRLPKPKERQHLFGGVLGGPIKRDRLFFFGSYEGLRLEQPQVALATVWAAAVRAQAPAAVRSFLNAIPLPNGREFANGTAELAASYSNPARSDTWALRLDAEMTNSLTGLFRISHAPSESKRRISGLSTVNNISARNDSVTGAITWIVGPRLTVDARVNWTRNQPKAFNELDDFGGAVVPASSDIFAPGRNPSNANFTFTSFGTFSWGLSVEDVQRQVNLVGALTAVSGAHQVKLGYDYRRTYPSLGGAGALSEVLLFTTAQRVRDGQANSYTVSNAERTPREPIFSSLSLYAQDTWHAGRRLTLTAGVRFERVPPPTEANGRNPRTLLGIGNDVLENPRLAPEGTPLFRSRVGALAPRIGAAYQISTRPGREITLRGGTGIFYDLGWSDIATAFQNVYPYTASVRRLNVQVPLSDAARVPPTLGIDSPGIMFLADPNLRMPYTYQWNTAWEQAIGSSHSLTVSYVGAAGRRLLVKRYYNTALAEWPTSSNELQITRNQGRSIYHALQMQFHRRLHRGVQALASYTLANARDNGSTDDTPSPPASQADTGEEQLTPSDYDVRHVLSAAVTYDLPKLSGPVLLRGVANNWGVDLLIRAQSAFPVTPRTLGQTSIAVSQRPDAVPGQPLYIQDPAVPGGRRFNPAAFVDPADPTRQGTFPRNGLRGFGASQVDLALRREFRLGEQVRLQLRAELFNLFNHPNFGPVQPFIISGLFGQPTSMLNQSLGGLNPLYQMGGPRSGQLALKVLF